MSWQKYIHNTRITARVTHQMKVAVADFISAHQDFLMPDWTCEIGNE